jgi:hypothetical protein
MYLACLLCCSLMKMSWCKGASTDNFEDLRNSLERDGIQLFEEWSIDVIGILLYTTNSNQHIIIAIERSTC